MWIRVLTAWPGSVPCGQVADVPDLLAVGQIRAGLAEVVMPVAPDVAPAAPETAMAASAEMAIVPRAKGRKRAR